jgi:hypothetical protein
MGQSRGKIDTTVGGRTVSEAHALADEAIMAISEAMQRAASKGPAKVIAFRTRLSDEGVRKIKDGDRKRHSLHTIIDFMSADPEVAAIVAHYAHRFNEPELFNSFETQKAFHRDIFRSART